MADRAGGEGNPVVPKEVFELDKDERWQARLDEARARREVALREKAAGKPLKPRPKPWEVDGAAVEKPPEINPIIQERGDDKFDFADRLETIREPQDGKDGTPQPQNKTPETPRDVVAQRTIEHSKPAPKRATPPPKAAAPEPRARPQPSLIMPGAPDVAELAARYAATLDKAEPRDTDFSSKSSDQARGTAELVTLPTANVPHVQEAQRPLTRAERRRGIRPLGMAFGLIAFAVLPLTTEAPPLETGPQMPLVDGLAMRPALGVTWGLYQPPVATDASDWRPVPGPRKLSGIPAPSASPILGSVAAPSIVRPAVPETGAVAWSSLKPIDLPVFEVLEDPGNPPTWSDVPTAAAPPAPTLNTLVEPNATEEAIGAPPRPPVPEIEPIEAPASGLSPQPRPNETVVEQVSDPLRVTILAPRFSDRTVAEEIANDVQNVGHELVRVKDVDFSISARNVRYFHEADRAAAIDMAERYDAEIRDFTWFRPRPVEGTTELWLSGRSSGTGTAAQQQEFVGRVLERLGLGTELPSGTSDGN